MSNLAGPHHFHSLKVEAIHGELFRTRDEARRTVFGWIECFYNLKRRHSALGYVSPAVFERNALKLPEAA